MPKRIVGNIVGLPSPRSDWNQTDEMKADFIKNKPDIEKIQTDITDLKTEASDLYGFKMYADEKLRELEAKQDSKVDKIDGYGLVAFESIMQIPGNEEVGFAITDDTGNYYATYNREYIKEKLNKKANVSDLDGLATKDEVGNLVKAVDDIKFGEISVMNAFNAEFAVVAACDIYNNPIESTYATKDELYPIPFTTIEGTLGVGTSYHLGEQTELTLLFPEPLADGAVIYINFESGETPTNLTVDTSNTTDFDLIPEANMGYEIYAKCNGRIWIVKYSEYEVV